MRLRKQISLFLSFAISITSMNVTALSNSISGMTKKAKAADIVRSRQTMHLLQLWMRI